MADIPRINPGYEGTSTVGNSGGGPNNSDVNERVAKLEASLPYLATKGDVSEAKTSIITFGATFGAALAAIIVGILLFAINRANPPAASQPHPQAIVIQLPAPSASTPVPVAPATK